MTPAVAFTRPEKTSALIDPFDVAASESGFVPIDVAPRDVNPCFVFLSHHRPHFAGARIAHHHVVRVLTAIELLNDQLVGIRRPFHAGQIVVARIAGNLKPASWTTVRVDDTDASR